MNQERLEASLESIRQLLSHLHGEITDLEANYSQVLLVLQKFERAVNLDELTGLLRRRAFFDKWNALLEECRAVGETCGVILVDIDHFKKINDTHGHLTGDDVIRNVAALLKRFEAPGKVVAGRYGGEEFAVAVRGTDSEILGLAELIRRSAERLRGPVSGPDGRAREGVEWKITLSAGMASTSRDGDEPRKLLARADERLYEAKRQGRNRVRAA